VVNKAALLSAPPPGKKTVKGDSVFSLAAGLSEGGAALSGLSTPLRYGELKKNGKR